MSFFAKHKTFWKIFLGLCAVGVCIALLWLSLNLIVVGSTKDDILSVEDAAALSDIDCILVLGCRVYEDGTPSAMLYDRVSRGIELYKQGAAGKLLMSGDHGRHGYDEVNTMKDLALAENVPSQDVFMDHAGFSTYESMVRAKEVFQAERVLIVTQEYHLPRAIYIAKSLGLEAYGCPSDLRTYGLRTQVTQDIRESIARCKDFFFCLFKPDPTYLGEAIPIWGDGNLTND